MQIGFYLLLKSVLLWNLVSAQRYTNKFLESNFPRSSNIDAFLDTENLLLKYNYPAQTHFVTTKDGYILRMHRIPKPKGQPILLMHGLLDSSATWIIMGPCCSLAYFLSDNGYDVWMGNVRGNRYSRNHTTLSPNQREFWAFSFHEIGNYDMPAMIDYVMKNSQFPKLAYVGHSQGTTIFWVMCSMHPGYMKLITSVHALAPVAFTKNTKTPLMGLMRNFVRLSGKTIWEFLPHSYIFYRSCFANKITLATCLESFWLMMGKNDKQINESLWPTIFGHVPAGSSLRQWRHFIQLHDSNRFCQYDFGSTENQKRYGDITPPDYNLTRIHLPVALYYCYNDYLSSYVDVLRLADLLPNVTLFPFQEGNHMTMMWARTAPELIFQPMLKILQEHTSDQNIKPADISPIVESLKYLQDVLLRRVGLI